MNTNDTVEWRWDVVEIIVRNHVDTLMRNDALRASGDVLVTAIFSVLIVLAVWFVFRLVRKRNQLER